MADRFELTDRILGEGGYGKVYLGLDTKTNKHVAIKMIRKDKLRKMKLSDREALSKEINAMKSIEHKNVIRVLSYVDNFKTKSGDELAILVLELASGGEFFDFLSYSGRMDEKLARAFFKQLIDGIEAIHEEGICHRDLKLENLLLDSNFTLKICDFGFARKFGADGFMKTNLGTPVYKAPEIISGKKYTSNVDIFAAGVVLFMMISGFIPFKHARKGDWWYDRLMEGNFKRFWEAHERYVRFSFSAKDIIVRMLLPNPEKRITIDEIKKHSFYKGESLSGEEFSKTCALRRKKGQQKKDKEMSEILDVSMSEEMIYRKIEQTIGVEGLPQPESDEKDGKPRDAPVWRDVTACYTKFFTKEVPKAMKESILDVLARTSAKSVETSEFGIQCNYDTTMGPISIAIDLFSHPNAEGVNVVTFRRRLGTPIGFQKAFKKIYANLVTKAVPEPKKGM